MAGYSGTPLVQKLGIKAGHRLALLQAPVHFTDTLGDLPEEVVPRTNLGGGEPFDVIVFFTDSRTELASRFPEAVRRLTPAGGLWIAWPKKSSGVTTDLSENVVRTVGLSAGLVDNKVCAMDETWSGLRFVIRLADRPKKK